MIWSLYKVTTKKQTTANKQNKQNIKTKLEPTKNLNKQKQPNK